MKKRCLAFMLCVHTVLFMMFQVASNVMAEEGAATQIDAQTGNGENTQGQAENSSEWLSYEDFMLLETTKAWNDPAMYVGFTAEFNTEMYDNFACVSDGDAIDFGSGADVSGGDADVSDGDAEITDDDTDYSGDDTEFYYSGDDFYEKLPNFANFVYAEELIDAEENSIKVIITDYYFDDKSDSLWYKVEAEEGYTLPDVLVKNPYVLHLSYPEEIPSFLIHPRKAMFTGDKVIVQKQPVAASRYEEVAVEDLPDFFDITWSYEYTENGLSWYDFGDISGWAKNLTPEYRYIATSSVKLIPAEVSHAYERLMSLEDIEDYEAYWSQISEEINRQFTDKHLVNLEKHKEDLLALENVEHSTTVMIDGKEIPITVRGKIPQTGVTLSASVVSAETVMQEGFDIKDATEIVAALDIKIINDEDGTEWQPKAGKMITVSLGMAELGYEDGKIFRLHHKHGEDIDVFELFVVMDGKIALRTNGFSLYVVSEPLAQPGLYAQPLLNPGDNQATANNPMSLELTVGEEVVYYASPRSNNEQNVNSNQYKSTWWVTDPDGAIFYEIHSTSTPGRYGVNGQWIRIVALRATPENKPISLRYIYTDDIANNYQDPNNTSVNLSEQYFSLTIKDPVADTNNDYKLYIKDEVNVKGVITATLVDSSGKEVTADDLEGEITYSWVRDDGAFIISNAYADKDKSINICIDHGGVLQSRLDEDKYVKYTVTATLPNGLKKTADYTVYYQSEIVNASFELPECNNARDYTFFTNGWPKLYWKTTSPGEGLNLSRDIEFARYNATLNGDFDEWVKFYPNKPADGWQIAEINAEKFGALYQDIITAPGEDLSWEFSHAERGDDSDEESMFIIIGPTEHAQKITDYSQLQELVQAIIKYDIDTTNRDTQAQVLTYLSGTTNGVRNSIRYTDPDTGAVYEVWYNDAEALNKPQNNAWTKLEGEYHVPEEQYRTRLFFVTNPLVGGASNYGNLIDSARGGQYKKYLIEYYEQTYTEGNQVVYDYQEDYDEKGEAIMYASVPLKNFIHFEEEVHDLLTTVYINGENSPYNVKYANNAPCLFIENYSTTVDNVDPYGDQTNQDKYKDYDIVMQVFFTDTIIAVQKWVEFPKIKVDGKDTEALTPDQKQTLVNGLTAQNGRGYLSGFRIDCVDGDGLFAEETIAISKNDPFGWYTGYIPIGDNPQDQHDFTLRETYVSPLVGLELHQVKFEYYRFKNGNREPQPAVIYENIEIQGQVENGSTIHKILGQQRLADNKLSELKEVAQENILLDTKNLTNPIKLAEIKVTNVYKEKIITINYVAVGNGNITVNKGNGTTEIKKKHTEEIAYYSGIPKGVIASKEGNYVFAGWYLDPECTQPVGNNHGYVDNVGGAFVPNKNLAITSDENLEVTYYAKFSIGALQIQRKNAEPGQVFVYKIAYRDEDASESTDYMYVTVVIGDNEEGSVEIVDVPFGLEGKKRYYTVTQLNDWSWRYGEQPVSIEKEHKKEEGYHGAVNMITVFEFTGNSTKDYWLNGNSPVETNTYGEVQTDEKK